jgi:hypothetical protein
VSTTLAH